MSVATRGPARVRLLPVAFWVLFFSFAAYLLLTGFLVSQRGGAVQLTLFFGDVASDAMASIVVVFYLAMDPGLTRHLYRRALADTGERTYASALGSVVVGVSAPYLYGLLLSFMGIMRDVFPVLYIAFFYVAGVVVGLRIIPPLVAHIQSR